MAGRASLHSRPGRSAERYAAPADQTIPWHDPENHFAPVTGTRDWTRHEVTTQVPADAISITLGFYLNGRRKIELRNPQLDQHQANE